MLDLLNLGEESTDYDDSPCYSCKRRFHCPNNDPEEPQYCSWYLTNYR